MKHYKITLTFKPKTAPTQEIKLWAMDSIEAEKDARTSMITHGWNEPVKKCVVTEI